MISIRWLMVPIIWRMVDDRRILESLMIGLVVSIRLMAIFMTVLGAKNAGEAQRGQNELLGKNRS